MANDGQHRETGGAAPGVMTGQPGKAVPGSFVGMECGAEFNMTIKAPKKDINFNGTDCP